MRKAAIGVIAALIIALAGAAAVSTYAQRRDDNLRMQQAISASWQAVDAVIVQRSDLAPGLIQAVKPYATRERAAIARLRQARAALDEAFAVPARIAANDGLSEALQELLAIADAYPELPATPEYKRLQDQLAAVENQLATQRRRYNKQVQEYNTRLQLFPNNLVAAIEGFEREEAYFRTNERARQSAPAVNFAAPEPAQ